MTKRLYNKIFIILLILCNSDKSFSLNFTYNLTQTVISKILDIIPSIKEKEIKNTEININKTENNINNEKKDIQNIQNIQNIENIQGEKNQQQIKNISISYPELIEEHYIWVAFLGTLLKHYNNNLKKNLPQINLKEEINAFFKEPDNGETTLRKLSNFFNNKSLKDNFINKKKTFINVIEEYSKKFINNDLFKIILELKEKLGENLKKELKDENKRKIALFWMFTVALGGHAAEELSKKAENFKNVFEEDDYIKINTLKYIEISFKERANLYKKLEKMFLLFYNLAEKNIENDAFISKIYENMKNNIGDACFNKSFINLMYRNRNGNDGYIDLVEAIRV